MFNNWINKSNVIGFLYKIHRFYLIAHMVHGTKSFINLQKSENFLGKSGNSQSGHKRELFPNECFKRSQQGFFSFPVNSCSKIGSTFLLYC